MEEKFKIYNEQEDKKQEEKQEELLENNEPENEELNNNTTVDEAKEETEIFEEVTTEPKEETEIFEEVPAEPKEETIIEEVKETKVSQEKDDKSKLLIMILAIIILVFAILAVTIPNLIKKEEEKTVIVDKPELKSESEYRMTGNNLQDFDINFLKLENKEVNKIYSPLSIKYALEMLSEGTEGTSKEQIEAILGDYKPRKYMNNQNMSFANAMFIKQLYKTEVKDEYTKNLIDKYYAEVIYDSFDSAGNINKWVSNKTFGLIDNLLDDSTVQRSNFFLVNALAIDMEWNRVIQARNMTDKGYIVTYNHEDYGASVANLMNGARPNLIFNNSSQKIESLEIGASINNYDIVTDLGRDNIKNTITKEYNEYINGNPCEENPLDTETYVEKFIKELDSNYRRIDVSTDFEFHVDEDVKIFAKDLKTYEGTTLQYVGIMPIKEKLTTFVEKTSAKEINAKLNSLKTIELNNFKTGVITKIIGYIPTFGFEYELDLKEDLKKMNVTDIFDEEKADLSSLTITKDTFIDSAIHKANIEFSNEGIKAAAATSLGGAGSSSCGFEHLYKVPVEIIDLTFDKPYLFLIRDKVTNEVWFTGTVYEPNKTLEKK